MSLLLIDNYDSFTQNIRHAFLKLGESVELARNDEMTAAEAFRKNTRGIILSPGPRMPSEAGICLDVLRIAAETGMPVLGICLGHQALGQAFGGKVVRVKPCHGKVSDILHRGEGLFKGLPSPFKATRYHSLVVEKASLPACLKITAESADGLIMGLEHRSLPLFGAQFHPESVSSEHGLALFRAFQERCA